ncbi:MerR family transcriptional regulator [Nocardia sp. 2]|uniref:MerR family transcriptional regulator n=1 Tax=Nocardia acididurans TaxID=2802282 RepID=A0ABS1MFA5_9NOCA|nr:MerR family transcriptional regulator [Nocardia acididurans]MBL1079336.1 MerR family transcriptional regulator [Nocardia acididurans]
MFGIGDFARFGRVSVRMLRHYDQIGLLTPVEVDPSTGYRFYSADQLARLNRIVALKDLGFTLQQVAALLDDRLTVDQMRGMLQLRRAQLANQLAADNARLAGVEARLRRIEKEGVMPDNEIIVKSVEATRVAELSDFAADFGDEAIGPVLTELFERLDKLVPESGLVVHEPSIAYYEDLGDRVRCHAALQVSGTASPASLFEVVELAGIPRAATMVHRGPLADLGPAFDVLGRWADENGYAVTCPIREVYLHCPPEHDSDEWVVELQLPIGPREA